MGHFLVLSAPSWFAGIGRDKNIKKTLQRRRLDVQSMLARKPKQKSWLAHSKEGVEIYGGTTENRREGSGAPYWAASEKPCFCWPEHNHRRVRAVRPDSSARVDHAATGRGGCSNTRNHES